MRTIHEERQRQPVVGMARQRHPLGARTRFGFGPTRRRSRNFNRRNEKRKTEPKLATSSLKMKRKTTRYYFSLIFVHLYFAFALLYN